MDTPVRLPKFGEIREAANKEVFKSVKDRRGMVPGAGFEPARP